MCILAGFEFLLYSYWADNNSPSSVWVTCDQLMGLILSQTRQQVNFLIQHLRQRKGACNRPNNGLLILRKVFGGKYQLHCFVYHGHPSHTLNPTVRKVAARVTCKICSLPVTCSYVYVFAFHIEKHTHSNKNLCTTMCNLNVLIVQEAAHDSDIGLALCGYDPRSLRHLAPHTAWPVFAPPWVMGWDVECQHVTVLKRKKEHLILGTQLFFPHSFLYIKTWPTPHVTSTCEADECSSN